MLKLLAMVLAFLYATDGSAGEPKQFRGKTQGTTYHISYLGPNRAQLQREVEKALATFDAVFSNYRSDSEISQINRQKTTDWLPLSAELYRVIAFALDVSRETEGAFDITLGTQLKAWGFGTYKSRDRHIPTDPEIAKALKASGYRLLELRENPLGLRKAKPEILIDLSGIAQGYAVDVISKLMDEQGISSYMVEIGGELFAKGEKAPGRLWTLAIDAPIASQGAIAQVVKIKDLALSTSGDYRNFFEKDGKRYSHVFDPRLGRPIDTELASASVLAPSCMAADAYAKAFMVLPEAKRKALAAKLNFPVFLMKHQGSGFEAIYLEGFERYLAFL